MKWPLYLQATKKWMRRIGIVFGLMYALGVVLWSWPRSPDCPVEEHSFQGQTLEVEFCLNHASDRQYIGIGIYSKEGTLLAWRSGTFDKESRQNYMAIEDAMIRYSDSPLDRINPPADCVLNMPPTWIDWLEARLPGGIPGVSHCEVASDEVVQKAQEQWDIRQEPQRIKDEQAARERDADWRARAPAASASTQKSP